MQPLASEVISFSLKPPEIPGSKHDQERPTEKKKKGKRSANFRAENKAARLAQFDSLDPLIVMTHIYGLTEDLIAVEVWASKIK